MYRFARPAVVVVAFGADDHLRSCLHALGAGFDVTVVDNGAAGTTRMIATAAGARYLCPGTNIGFAAAVNLGLAARPAGSDVVLLNPDARLDAAGVGALHGALHAPGMRRAAVGPRLVDPAGGAQRAAWPVPSPAQVWLDALGLGRWWRGRSFVAGTAIMLAATALEQLGGLDERYFLYAEEADWQLRALRAGWSVAVVDGAVATHAGGASSSDPARRDAQFADSARAFARRWYGPRGAALMRAGSVVAAARRALAGGAAARPHHRRMLRLFGHPGVRLRAVADGGAAT